MLWNFGQPQRPDGGARRQRAGAGERVPEDGFPVFGRHRVARARGRCPAGLPADRSGQLFHLLRGRHAPACGAIGHSMNRTYREHTTRVCRCSKPRKMILGTAGGCRNQGPLFVLSPNRPRFGVPRTMAPRANWKGFLRLSLVNCPVALYPATSESEKVSFNQLNRKTGHRIKYFDVGKLKKMEILKRLEGCDTHYGQGTFRPAASIRRHQTRPKRGRRLRGHQAARHRGGARRAAGSCATDYGRRSTASRASRP
jgi:hypothetical protein